jgi:hypothetical protein
VQPTARQPVATSAASSVQGGEGEHEHELEGGGDDD